MVYQPSLNRPSSGNGKTGDSESVTGLAWQDFHLDAPRLASAPWCPQKRHLLRGLSHCCVLRPSLLSSPASPSTLFPGYLLHTPHLTRTTRFCIIHYYILVTHYCLQNSRSVFVGGLAPRGRAQAPHGGGRTLTPPNDTRAKDLPSRAPSLVFLKGFFFCVIRSSWQLCTVQLNTQVLFLQQIC